MQQNYLFKVNIHIQKSTCSAIITKVMMYRAKATLTEVYVACQVMPCKVWQMPRHHVSLRKKRSTQMPNFVHMHQHKSTVTMIANKLM